MSKSRQLAAIMFTDIVGFTALMGSDEKKTLEILEKNRQIHKPLISEHNGQWIKELGDGVLATFSTVSDAVNAAIKIMEACNTANEYQLSIGIHSAEVVFENDDVFGDGVNIAARIEAAAPAGCILISESVQKNLSNKKDIQTHFVREEKLKNVDRPIRLYQVLTQSGEIVLSTETVAPIQEKSIAVLPFVNMSSDPEQEYFSDGISEEIINMLAQVPTLKVIGRSSSFAFKEKNMDLREIGKLLNAQYILEGSVRKGGDKLRITAQLIKVDDGFHIYSEKFDRVLDDIFSIQDEIALSVLNTIKVKLLGSAKDVILKKYTDNFKVYELYLKGRYHLNKFTPKDLLEAVKFFEYALNLEPNYSIAYADISQCYVNLWGLGWMSPDQSIPQMIEAAQKALQLDPQIAESHFAMGRVNLHYDWKFEEAIARFEKSISINPNSAECHIQLGFCAILFNDYSKAKMHADMAESLDPYSLMNLWYAAVIFWMVRDYDKLLAKGLRIIDLEPNFFGGHMWAALANLELGNHKEVIHHAELQYQLNPVVHMLYNLWRSYYTLGNEGKAREVFEKLISQEGEKFFGYTWLGEIYALQGKLDEAFIYYKKAFEQRESQLFFTRNSLPNDLEILEDPRMVELYNKIGLPYLISYQN